MNHLRFKKLLNIILLLSIGLSNPGISAAQTPDTAQNASPSAAIETIETDTPVPESILDLSIPSTPPSAVFQPDDYVAKLTRVAFQAKEKIEFVVKNALPTTHYKIEIKNSNSNELNVKVDEKYINGEYVFGINPEVGMIPGTYTVRIIDADTNETVSQQDFNWGVLAINTNKSMYLPEEIAQIAIGVLDEGGRMVCDATVSLEIESPLGTVSTLSTQNGGIVVNPECLMHEVTERPDYESSYLTSTVGRYNMKLTANTINGTFTVNDRFEVREVIPFEVERITATRIYPPKTYPVKMKVKANQDFRGKIIESVPYDFQITPGPEGTLSYSQESGISESYNLQAESNIPDLSLPFDDKYPVTLGFGQQIDRHGMRDRYKKSGIDGHDGIDFALPLGTPVLAVDGGEVILAEENWVYGHTVVIEHSWGRSYYGHLSEIGVKPGEILSTGNVLGLSGNTGLLTTGPHLHFSIKPKTYDIHNLYYGKIDPAPFFGLAIEDAAISTADYPIAAKAIVWNVDLKAGDEITIGYHYKAPYRSPYFYSIGPLQFVTSDIPEIDQAKFDVTKNPFVLGTATPSAELTPTQPPNEPHQEEAVIFSELRQWQIASDADSTVVLDADADGTCGSGCWTVPSDWTDVNTIYAIGGGGAGDNLATGGGGGGGGAFASITNLDLTAGNNITFGIGSGGTDAVNGGSSWFNAANAAACISSATCVKGAGGTTATSATGGAGGSIAGTNSVGTARFPGGTGGNGSNIGDQSTGGGGGAGSPNGTGGTGGAGDPASGGAEAMGGGGGSGCDSIGASNDGVIGGANGGNGGNSCFANGGTGGNGVDGNPGSNGSGGGGGDHAFGGGDGGDGVSASDPSLAGGGGGGGDDDNSISVPSGGNGGLYGGGGGGSINIGLGAGGVIIIIYTQLISGPTNDQIMRHGKWFSSGVEQSFAF